MRKSINIILISVFVLFAMTLSFAGEEKASFALKDETGKVYTQDSFRGKEFVLFVFTFECPHCRRTMPLIQKMYKEGIPVLGVAYSTRYRDLDGKRKKAGLLFPIAIGTKEFKETFSIRGVPTMFLITTDGMIKERFSGTKGAGRLEESLRKKK